MSSIEGVDEVFDALDGLKEEILLAALQGLREGMELTVKAAKNLCPEKDGQLRNSITSMAEIQGDKIDAKVTPTAEYAICVEMGTGPKGEANHAGISPNAKPVYTVTGTDIKRVSKKGKPYGYHLDGWFYIDPETEEFRYTEGQPARPFMYPAFRLTKDALITKVKTAINNRR